jgi:uncharacterized membrane protein YfcA
MDWIAILSGFGVGAIVGMTGVGGGSLMTPLLLSVFKLNPAVAIGTDLWFAAVTKTAGSAAHHHRRPRATGASPRCCWRAASRPRWPPSP